MPLIIDFCGDSVVLRQVARMGIGNCLSKPFDLERAVSLVGSLAVA